MSRFRSKLVWLVKEADAIVALVVAVIAGGGGAAARCARQSTVRRLALDAPF